MDAKEIKKPLTYEEQVQKIIDKGCIIDNKEKAIAILERINYYRLSAYFLPFKGDDGKYIEGTSIETVYKIHEFDEKLRRLIFNTISSIELELRAQIAYHHSRAYGALGYTDKSNFNSKHNHDRLIENVERNIENNKNQLFIKHCKSVYNGKFPIWVIIELFSFGELSHFYSDMKTAEQKIIAKRYNATPKNLSSWLLCLTILRNYCTHYSRLYFNSFATAPATPKDFPYTLNNKAFDYILVLKFLCHSNKEWYNSFLTSLEAMIEEYSEYIKLEHLGFPDNWLELLKLNANV